MSYETAAALVTGTKSCERCSGDMVKLEIGTRLSVHMPGDTPEAYWTDLFARNPRIFKR
jgi:hypothetical protein